MGRIETEAREVLLRRRRSLFIDETPPAGDPAARWSDYEFATDPLSEVVRREVAAIDEALLRIEQDRYGSCQACGGPLGLQRLRALPEARYCLACSGNVPGLE